LGRPGACSAWLVVPFAVTLAACTGGAREPEDPESAHVSRLLEQGFAIVSDGRADSAPTALRYQGNPAPVVACQADGGRFRATDQAGSATTPDGRFVVEQAGEVAAYVIVADSGGLRGVYENHVLRNVSTPDGRLVARQLEKIEFAPTGTGRFRNGVTCRANL
jgi:hypothetical protein